jgi:hypothetical protein
MKHWILYHCKNGSWATWKVSSMYHLLILWTSLIWSSVANSKWCFSPTTTSTQYKTIGRLFQFSNCKRVFTFEISYLTFMFSILKWTSKSTKLNSKNSRVTSSAFPLSTLGTSQFLFPFFKERLYYIWDNIFLVS